MVNAYMLMLTKMLCFEAILCQFPRGVEIYREINARIAWSGLKISEMV